MSKREFDIVLYGATGFAGKLTAEYLAKAGGDSADRAGGPFAATSCSPFGRRWGNTRSRGH